MKLRMIWMFVIGLAVASTATAQTKVTGTISCANPDPAYSIDAGDRAGHSFVLMKYACTWTTPMQYGDVTSKDGTDVTIGEANGTKVRVNGNHFSNLSNGDKIFVHYSGTDTMTKDGKPESTMGTWRYTGGTGKFKGITGKGTYKGKPDASGNMAVEVEGDYTLPAKK